MQQKRLATAFIEFEGKKQSKKFCVSVICLNKCDISSILQLFKLSLKDL